MGGGGAEVVAAATWKPVGGRGTAMTVGPDRSTSGDGATAATGVMAVRADGVRPWDAGAAPLTAPANTRGVIMAMPNTGDFVRRMARRRTESHNWVAPSVTAG
ncbi:hypothetical protein LAUMK7_04431 [Mycobacterium kansasii]|nr:hypothetical protein LAUMK22_03804 [Mycobacterium kansasii]VAZ68418.1 hypothetical protein LAUMK40_04570 [Mycobacterium kansasii]VAZ78652.1 hypothetical protein LAUMK7_04431 [Mycobacterium kansasii]